MTNTLEVQEILAKDRKAQILREKIRNAEGILVGTTLAYQSLASLSSATSRDMDKAKSELAELEAGGGVGITSDFGQYSTVDQLLRAERFAGKGASVDFIKANPDCTELEAEAAWEAAGKAVTNLPLVLVPVSSYALLYRMNLVAAGFIPEPTWEAQRAWIIATDKTLIMGA